MCLLKKRNILTADIVSDVIGSAMAIDSKKSRKVKHAKLTKIFF